MNEQSSSDDAPKKKSGKLGPVMVTVVSIVGALILFCIVGIGIVAYQDSTPEGQATNTAEAIARESTQVVQTAEAATNEAAENIKATEDAKPTNTPLPTQTAEATNTLEPEPTNSPEPLPSDTPQPVGNQIATVSVASANIRGGPSTDFSPIATAVSGDELVVIALNEQRDWANVQLADGSLGWIALSIVEGDLSAVPVAVTIPAPQAVAENPTQPPAAEPTQAAEPAQTAEPTQAAVAQPTAPPQLPPPSYNNCFPDPNPSAAPHYPIKIVSIDKEAKPETVTLANVSPDPVDLNGWNMCSIKGNQRHDGVGGSLAPGESRVFPYTGSGNIWSNDDDDDGALYNTAGQLVSYWND